MAAFYDIYWTNGYGGQGTNLPSRGPLYQAATAMTLAAIVTTQIGNLFAHRAEHASVWRIGLFTNRLAWVGIATELALIVVIVHTPLLQAAFGSAAFPWTHWLLLLACAPTCCWLTRAQRAAALSGEAYEV